MFVFYENETFLNRYLFFNVKYITFFRKCNNKINISVKQLFCYKATLKYALFFNVFLMLTKYSNK